MYEFVVLLTIQCSVKLEKLIVYRKTETNLIKSHEYKILKMTYLKLSSVTV